MTIVNSFLLEDLFNCVIFPSLMFMVVAMFVVTNCDWRIFSFKVQGKLLRESYRLQSRL